MLQWCGSFEEFSLKEFGNGSTCYLIAIDSVCLFGMLMYFASFVPLHLFLCGKRHGKLVFGFVSMLSSIAWLFAAKFDFIRELVWLLASLNFLWSITIAVAVSSTASLLLQQYVTFGTIFKSIVELGMIPSYIDLALSSHNGYLGCLLVVQYIIFLSSIFMMQSSLVSRLGCSSSCYNTNRNSTKYAPLINEMETTSNLHPAKQCEMYKSSLISQLYFWWVFPLLVKGFRNKSIQIDDLGEMSGRDLPVNNMKELVQALTARKDKERAHDSPLPWYLWLWNRPTLFQILYTINLDLVLGSAAYLLVSAVAGLSSLFLLQTLLLHLDNYPHQAQMSYFLALALFIAKLIESCCEHQFWIVGTQASMRMQSGLVAVATYKMLRLSPESQAQYGVGKITNFLTVDARKMNDQAGVQMLHWGTWCALLYLAVSVYALYALLGISSLIGVGILVGVWPISIYLSRKVKAYVMTIQGLKDSRSQIMSDVLSQMRTIKAFNWQSFVFSVIQVYRNAELHGILKFQVVQGLLMLLTTSSQLIAPVATLAYYALVLNGRLTASTVFTALGWFSYLQRGLSFLPGALAVYYEVSASLGRLDVFFDAEERQTCGDWMEFFEEADTDTMDSTTATDLEDQIHMNNVQEKRDAEFNALCPGSLRGLGALPSIELVNASFRWRTATLESSQRSNSISVRSRSVDSIALLDPQSAALALLPTKQTYNDGEVLQDININMSSGQLMFVIGCIGSGKSSLLMSLMGELSAAPESRVVVVGSTGYVSGKPWMANKSIRDNITFGRDFVKEWFDKVVWCCCLEEDLAGMPNRESTEVGERGINLSGGQQQRINLARAIYTKPDIIILDDVFSALDGSVGNKIFERCFSPTGILALTIRIIATHQYHYIANYPLHCSVLVLGKGGVMLHNGSWQEVLNSTSLEIVGLIKAHNDSQLSSSKDDSTERIVAVSLLDMPANSEKASNSTDSMVSSSVVKKVVTKVEPSKPTKTFVTAEQQQQGTVQLRHILRYVDLYGSRFVWIFMISLMAVEQAIVIYESFWFADIAAECDDVNNTKCSRNYLVRVVKILFAIVFGAILSRGLRIMVYIIGAQRAAKALHNELLSALLNAKISFFDTQLTGRILNRCIGDMSSIDRTVPMIVLNFLQYSLSLISVTILVAYEIPLALVALAAIIYPYFKVYQFYRWSARDLKRLDSQSKSPINSHISETIAGMSTIRAFGCQCTALREHLKCSAVNVQCYWYQWCGNQWVTTALELLGVLFTGVILMSAVYYCDHGLGSSYAALMISNSMTMPGLLGWVLKMLCQVEVECVAIERVSEYVDLDKEEETNLDVERDIDEVDHEIDFKDDASMLSSVVGSTSSMSASKKSTASRPQVQQQQDTDNKSSHSFSSLADAMATVNMQSPVYSKGLFARQVPSLSEASRACGRLNGSVSFFNVSLSYESEDLTSEPRRVLNDLSFQIDSGEKIAVCGRTGAGKTSIFQALLRFYSYSGSIWLDGKELSGMSRHKSRARFAIIPQDSHLIGETIGAALIGPQDLNLLEDTVLDILQRCQVADKVEKMGGLHAPMRNGSFSAGERQLMCTARAILQSSDIILCDEMSSSLDCAVDEIIHDIVLTDPRTVISIMHRLAHAHKFDRIIVMSNGSVGEMGTPHELMNKKGLFYDMVTHQQELSPS